VKQKVDHKIDDCRRQKENVSYGCKFPRQEICIQELLTSEERRTDEIYDPLENHRKEENYEIEKYSFVFLVRFFGEDG